MEPTKTTSLVNGTWDDSHVEVQQTDAATDDIEVVEEVEASPEAADQITDLPTDIAAANESRRSTANTTTTDEVEPYLVRMQDHFTLPTASSLVRFRDKRNAARVFENKNTQIIMEETYDPESKDSKISVKRLNDGTPSLQILRTSYTMVCALWTGFIFVFCLQVLLYLILDLAIETGATEINADVHVFQTIGVVLAIYGYVRGFAEALVIAGHYVADTWGGHFLVKQFILRRYSDILTDWVFFAFFIFIPAIVMCITLFAGLENWWTITSFVWFCSVMGFYIIFAVNVVIFEVRAAYEFEDNKTDTDSDKFWDVIKRCIILRQINTYSGRRKEKFIARSAFNTTEDTEEADKSSKIYGSSYSTSKSLWSRFTKWQYVSADKPGGLHLFRALPKPIKLYTVEDVQDYRPFITRHTWSLERTFCQSGSDRYITIVRGPEALTSTQLRSSFVCSLVGTFVVLLMVLSLLSWMDMPRNFFAIIIPLLIVGAFFSLRGTRGIYRAGKDLLDIRLDIKLGKDTDEPDASQRGVGAVEEAIVEPSGLGTVRDTHYARNVKSEGIYIVKQYFRETEATAEFCFISLALELIIFFLYPLISLFAIENYTLASLFLLITIVSYIRYYVNAAIVIEETGNMDLVNGETPQQKWENQSRLSNIVEAITRSGSRKIWGGVLSFFGFAFILLFLSAVGSSAKSSFVEENTYLNDFYYPPKDNDIRYPTCNLAGIPGGFGADATMADYVFLSRLAYRQVATTSLELEKWFGDNTTAIDRQDIVDAWRLEADEVQTAVTFKLIEFPKKSLAVILIRGTHTQWDMLTDSQLWAPAFMLQAIRTLLPAGQLWTPILDQLVDLMTAVQSDSVKKVSFYKTTTKFAEYVKTLDYSSVHVTGHSLGGGLSIITGAQAQIPAIALSGPNARISGRSFYPPISYEDLNRYTFNIVPRNDIVATIDDLADQHQIIDCTADSNDLVGCHDFTRSLCEVLFTCGSDNRPVLCACHQRYNYPKPLSLNNGRDFDEACPVEDA